MKKISLALYFIVLILLVIFIILFAKNNAVPVAVNILSTSFISQLWIIILSSFVLGIFVAMSFSLYSILRLKLKLSKLSKMHIHATEQTQSFFTEQNTDIDDKSEQFSSFENDDKE